MNRFKDWLEQGKTDKVRFWRLNREDVISRIRVWAETLSNDPNVICVVLFGSLARGNSTASSDADLLIILRTSDKRFDERIPDFLPSGIGVGAGVFPYTLDEANEALTEGFGVVETAFREGIWLIDKEGLKNNTRPLQMKRD
ncbi:MAG TPA: nucleotidyltransferase domain-containing protein [Thermodesulfobacteriota bacterium]|nr:nucleotidyltransferase domain-containing protein [Thermodesulfobacteriota bacterium]